MFPTYIRAATQSFVAASNWLFAFLIARFTPQMFKAMGYGVYLFFASLMVLSIPFVYVSRCIPLGAIRELTRTFSHSSSCEKPLRSPWRG